MSLEGVLNTEGSNAGGIFVQFNQDCTRVADMLEVVGERVGGWCGRDSSTSLRQAVRARRRQHNDVYSKLDAEIAVS
ncbi:hypothetical protein RR46_00267 [Papilio xuthus]|uniref:Uncharacterized protein n=1 Tax=Papilio xuthus TaxID=66420 RepID=A0A0N0PAE1_PAPXU|nr:hypothetical protein RR46_00267 [Papilio xuthus]